LFQTGIKLTTIKQVTSALYYAKEVEMKNGKVELVEVTIKEIRMKEIVDKEWRSCLEVDLKVVDMEENEEKRELTAVEIVERWELLRDCWHQLAVIQPVGGGKVVHVL
jgi:hypothetical protein